MKCRACYANEARVRQLGGWQGLVARGLLLKPVMCSHCFHRTFIPTWAADEEEEPETPTAHAENLAEERWQSKAA